MAISTIGGMYSSRMRPGIWTGQQKIMVGRDIGRMSATGFTSARPNVVVGGADDVRFTSQKLFEKAKEFAMEGRGVRNFRNISDNALSDDRGITHILRMNGELEEIPNKFEDEIQDSPFLHSNGKHAVAYSDDSIIVLKKNEHDEWEEDYRVK